MLQGGEDLLWRGFTDERRGFLSTLPATPGERRLAFIVVAVSAAIFFALIPFAKTPLAPLWAFIPIYQSALAVHDLIPAVLLFGRGGFPALVIASALLKDGGVSDAPTNRRRRARSAVLAGIGTVGATVLGLTLLATAGQDLLPSIMQGNHYTPAMIFVVSGVWALSLLALVILWRRPPHSVLDLWLMVVMCAWLFDIALPAVFNPGRFDLGFYAGRTYGF